MKRILCSALVMFGLFIAAEARADDPPSATITVFVYYDGSPDLAEIHNEALLGFAEDPAYLPVIETDDPIEFGTAVAAGGYDVFVAVTSDAAAAEQWAEQVPVDRSLTIFYPDPSDEYEIVMDFVHAWRPDVSAPPVPDSLTESFPDSRSRILDITDYVLGNDQDDPPACSSGDWVEATADEFVDRIVKGIDEHVTPWIDALQAWLEELRRKAQEEAAEKLEKFAEVLEGMPHPEGVEATIEIEAGIEHGLPRVNLKLTVKCRNAENAAHVARGLAEAIRPTTQPAQ